MKSRGLDRNEPELELGARTSKLRILHTADWHLGKTLDDRARMEEHQMFLDFLLKTISDQQINALLIAGDVFDSANPPQSALACYYDFLSRLHRQSACRVIIIAGNHDSPALLEAPREILRGLDIHVIGRLGEPNLIALPNDDQPHAMVAAVPFLRDTDLRTGSSGQNAADIQRELNEGIERIYIKHAIDTSLPLLAMGHLTVVGCAPSDSEREIHIGGLGAFPSSRFPEQFRYIALGHLHRPQGSGKDDRIRYSGSPIALSFSESGDKKQLRLIEQDASGELTNASLPLPDFRRLLRITADTLDVGSIRAAIEKDLLDRPSIFPAWVELKLKQASADRDVRATLEALQNEGNFEILRVLQPQETNDRGIGVDAAITWEQNPLDDPMWVFEQRLSKSESITEEDREALRLLFQQVLEEGRDGK